MSGRYFHNCCSVNSTETLRDYRAQLHKRSLHHFHYLPPLELSKKSTYSTAPLRLLVRESLKRQGHCQPKQKALLRLSQTRFDF